MKATTKVKAELTPSDIEEIIKAHFKKTYENVGPVKFSIGQELRGQRTDEHYVPVFNGATVEIEIKL